MHSVVHSSRTSDEDDFLSFELSKQQQYFHSCNVCHASLWQRSSSAQPAQKQWRSRLLLVHNSQQVFISTRNTLWAISAQDAGHMSEVCTRAHAIKHDMKAASWSASFDNLSPVTHAGGLSSTINNCIIVSGGRCLFVFPHQHVVFCQYCRMPCLRHHSLSYTLFAYCVDMRACFCAHDHISNFVNCRR